MSQYTNLPGVNLNIMDGQMNLTEDNTRNSLLIIAPVLSRANLEVPGGPVLVRNQEDLEENFGGFFYKGEMNPIAAEWSVARRGGIRNIYLLALEGETEIEQFVDLQDKLYNVVPDMNIEQVVLSGMYADQDIQGLTAAEFGEIDLADVQGVSARYVHEGTPSGDILDLAESGTATLTFKKGNQEIATLTVTKSAKVEDLVEYLNNELLMNNFEVDIEIDYNGERVRVMSSEKITLEGTKILTVLGLPDVESTYTGIANPARLLGDFAEKYSAEAQSLIAYISVEPVVSTDIGEISKKVDTLIKRNNNISKHVQVVAGPQVGVSLPNSLRVQWLTGVTQYAALVNRLPVQTAPTNQPLPQANQLRYNLSLRQLDRLTGKKYVTFRVKNNQIILVDGVTSAPDLFVGQDVVPSDYTRLSTVRIINDVAIKMRDALDAFIGQPNEFPIYNAMNTAIKGVIKDSISNGIIQDAKYTIALGKSIDESVVNLTILPQFELRKIDLSIGLSTPDAFNA